MNILKCKYCGKIMQVEDDDINTILLIPKNSKNGNEICRKYGHSFVKNEDKKMNKNYLQNEKFVL